MPLRPAEKEPRWEVVRDPQGFAKWEQAWRGDDGPAGVLRADLLDYDSVVVLAVRAGSRVVAGAILNTSSEVVGISNVFADSQAASPDWAGCLALTGTLFPELTPVGYESGAALDAARVHGFKTAGPLRVWVYEG
jgi:hypothetical protein